MFLKSIYYVTSLINLLAVYELKTELFDIKKITAKIEHLRCFLNVMHRVFANVQHFTKPSLHVDQMHVMVKIIFLLI